MKRSDFIKAVSASIFFGAGAEVMGAARKDSVANAPKNSSKGAKMDGKKMLVVYYSWSGNTRCVADFIAKLTGADVLEVVPEKAYPTSYSQTVDIAKKGGLRAIQARNQNEDFEFEGLRFGFCGLAELVGHDFVAD